MFNQAQAVRRKKMVRCVLVTIFLIVFGILSYATFQQWNHGKQPLASVGDLPDIIFPDLQNGEVYRIKDSIAHRPICLVYIDPDCYFCRELVEDILTGYDCFGNIRICLISSVPTERLNRYMNEMNLKKYPKIKFLSDESLVFPKTFGAASTPTTLIYDKQSKLLASYKGFVRAEKIWEIIGSE